VADQATGSVESGGGANAPAFVTPGHAAEHGHNAGRPISWIAVVIIIVGFIVGGVAMVPHPTWWLFWVGTAVAVVGCVITMFAKTFSEDWY
jgi:hypothetical protein